MVRSSGAQRPYRRTHLRHSLFARTLAGSVLVAVCSITATAWLAVQGTSESISAQQGRTLATDTRIHDTLIEYAATHPRWDGVQGAVDDLAADTGRRVALTTESQRLIADSAEGTPLPGRTASVVDPLAVDVTFAEDADRIDPRAVGPFALDEKDAARLKEQAESGAECVSEASGHDAEVVVRPSGRPAVELPDGTIDASTVAECRLGRLLAPTPGEEAALEKLNGLIDTCLEPHDGLDADYWIDPVTGTGVGGTIPDVAAPVEAEAPAGGADRYAAWSLRTSRLSDTQQLAPQAASCIDSSRRKQLAPDVAPAALLYIAAPEAQEAGGLELSSEGALRVFGAVLVVLLLTVAVSITLAVRLIRPVHALTDAVRRMRAGEGPARVAVRDSGEIGQLSAAFNEMSEHLERLEQQRKAMVSDVSHELRTPLSNLRGWLEAVQDGIADLGPDRMAMLVEETRLLQRIIDDLQELALADAGKLQLFLEPVDAGDLVEQAVARHRLRTESAGPSLVTDIGGEIPLVADRARMLQVIGNLVSNALCYTSAPGSITVRARKSDDAAVIEVGDTGTGIAPEHLPYVFDRFWRAEESRSRHSGGSGLGLAIIRDLVELHDGGVTVASTLGEGTVFTIRLPLDTADSPEDEPGSSS
ncbi:ATP-binding protein [Streptomonospora salina]|uniref:histidine kinase n=1 Tax=Streptomonospora salina TaxID=104205 RepID=A0A841E6B9_9ACTN|nr:ATP-binding protein [Streptomonospora salina]MBB5998342.1 two-component system sensor histidine kinase BaeS [Streptomonospora salina]